MRELSSKRRVIHAAQIALGYAYDSFRRGEIGGVKQGLIVTTATCYKQAMPVSNFALFTVLALNQFRNGNMTIVTEDKAEQAVCEGLVDALNATGGQSDLKEAMLLAQFIDAQDLDMQMVAEADDNSGLLVFDFADLALVLSPAFRCLRGIHLKKEFVPPPKVDAGILRPKAYAVADSAIPDMPKMLAAMGVKTR
ncbi:hypothetical protein RGQ15_10345 [Paracoccus sp. MBLB3053]|uniref:Uncharacterized protein n=1 Tax=Paracoccus aurantius TaxID=3073814 RepID=A0ABU2HTQ4_9RHOB|nr:hypothetical protein [Paracoccus sp. MBLB3053]MDS9467964.1 hypothetical protein [Paracoccus sp. MBLB3053]